MDKLLESHESHFVVANDSVGVNQEQYQNQNTIILFSVFALIILFILYIMMQILLNKRIEKEIKIMKRYHYYPLFIQMMKAVFLLVIVFIPQLACLSQVCDWLNHLANTLGFANIVTYSVANYAKSFMMAAIGVIVLEGGIYVIRTRQMKFLERW